MKIPTKKTTVSRIIQISDTHIAPDSSICFDGVDTSQSLQSVLALIAEQEQALDLILLTGDLAYDPDIQAYQKLRSLLRDMTVPIICLPGNHDSPDMMATVLNTDDIHLLKSLTVNNWSVLLLNTWQQGQRSGRLSQMELDFLRASLDNNPAEYVMIALHHHPLPCGSAWMDAMMLENPEELTALIKAHPKVKMLIWGHIHQEFEHRDEQILYLGSPSTCAQFKPNTEQHERDTLAPGYRVLELYTDGSIDTSIERVTTTV